MCKTIVRAFGKNKKVWVPKWCRLNAQSACNSCVMLYLRNMCVWCRNGTACRKGKGVHLRVGLNIVICFLQVSVDDSAEEADNKWGCIRVLCCDFFSTHFWGEWTTCPCKITVMCVNIVSKTANIRELCADSAQRNRIQPKKWIWMSLIFPLIPNHQQRRVEKIAACIWCKKKSFTEESSAESCGKKSQCVALA